MAFFFIKTKIITAKYTYYYIDILVYQSPIGNPYKTHKMLVGERILQRTYDR